VVISKTGGKNEIVSSCYVHFKKSYNRERMIGIDTA
jgi:hypothetical protein